MNFSFFFTTHQIKTNIQFNLILIIFLSVITFASCSSTKRFAEDDNYNATESNFIRVLLKEQSNKLVVKVDSQIILSDKNKKLAKVNSGNNLIFSLYDEELKLTISNKEFVADTFYLDGNDDSSIIQVDNKKYRGRLKIFGSVSQIKVVNQIGLEDYVKGVMTREMPIGKGNENYEALKAFSICVRTYALLKIFENKSFYDIYPDTRDQVYGGVDAETQISSKAVNETKRMILSYNGSPAVVFFHSTCGGFTEDVGNVFSKIDLPYLKTIEDGSEPYCNIAPKFNWTEQYSEALFVTRLYDAKLIPAKNYIIKNLEVKSRFKSGRVSELIVDLLDNNNAEKRISMFGNNIRYVIKTSDGKSILRSTLFNIFLQDDNEVLIKGKGYGHGVGLCQWGAIGQSRKGLDYQSILNHYFHGTKIINYYD